MPYIHVYSLFNVIFDQPMWFISVDVVHNVIKVNVYLYFRDNTARGAKLPIIIDITSKIDDYYYFNSIFSAFFAYFGKLTSLYRSSSNSVVMP